MAVIWVRVRHDELGETDIPTKSLPRYQARGWQPVTDEPESGQAESQTSDTSRPAGSTAAPAETTEPASGKSWSLRSKKES